MSEYFYYVNGKARPCFDDMVLFRKLSSACSAIVNSRHDGRFALRPVPVEPSMALYLAASAVAEERQFSNQMRFQ